ncbi:CRISPR-associated endonuclease Cas2 [Thalassovita aquimarina]|uniref:CRISPR-associated endoribonuclease Cas2 n=1 Tax=Thalassovita aquimarina TaxID=2785917 RepID=A0ABS5HSN8_9RHOB|nr:CRISPR-associated endonuclease Cas2 [Thalassovita aquimarina]MBR9651935.1 CRISPR-associated endonuclease Cas2 [Thalassovita aquimarina]
MTTPEFSQLSRYRIMWIWALFDLPVLTRTERKNATRFRNDLLDLGFQMVQYSVYLRHAYSKEKADTIAAKVGDCVPETGHVQILFFTDRQYQLSQSFHGKQASRPVQKKPDQLTLF